MRKAVTPSAVIARRNENAKADAQAILQRIFSRNSDAIIDKGVDIINAALWDPNISKPRKRVEITKRSMDTIIGQTTTQEELAAILARFVEQGWTVKRIGRPSKKDLSADGRTRLCFIVPRHVK